LLDAGKALPDRTRDDSDARIDAIVTDLLELVREYRPECIVIEGTSGKVSARHKGAGAGLAIYGQAVGEVRRAMKVTGIRVVMVKENEWTRGCAKKFHRQVWCESAYPKRYDREKDKGGDVADAIKLGRWWLEVQRLSSVPAGVEGAA
jgi:Holliday junction resolvasome RuvABC endonuclease subunit